MRNTYNIYCVNKDKHMLVHLLKFMVAECGCNSADSALKGHIFAEAYSFPSTVPFCDSGARAFSHHYEDSRGRSKIVSGFYFNLKRES